MKLALKALIAGAALAAFASPAQADLVYLGNFSGQDCPGTGPGSGGFSDCWATQTGVVYEATTEGSPSVYKYDSDGGESLSDLFPSIDGSEFAITFDGTTQTLSFTYTPGADDPALHYFSIKQANSGYALFYDADGILSGSIDLDTANNGDPLFPGRPGYSHITFYDTGAIPEPAVWAMMLFGFGAVGAAMRRRRGTPAVQFA